jgi:hypothetical protein
MIAGLGLWYSASDPAYDGFTYEQAIPTLFDSSGNGWDAAQATGSNQARFLTHDGNNYLRLTAISGNFASLPSAAIPQITGLLSIRFKFRGTASGIQYITGKFNSTSNRVGFAIRVTSSRELVLTASTAANGGGSSDIVATSDAAIYPANTDSVCRVDRDATSGDIAFYTSADNGASWSQVGATITGQPTGSLHNSTADVEIGSRNGGTLNLLTGTVSWSEIWQDGVRLSRFDANAGNFNSATVPDTVAGTWTINKSGLNPAMIVSARAFLPLTDDFYDISASAADVLRNVSGGTMIAARACNSVADDMNALTISTTSVNIVRAFMGTTTTGYRVGGRRLDADSAVVHTATTQQAVYEFAVQCGRLNNSDALSANIKNGALVGTEDAFQTAGLTSDTASSRLRVFSNTSTTPGSIHSGPVTDLCLYNRALTNSQIRFLSRYFAGRTGGAITV